MKLRDRLTGLGVECREERRSHVPHVVMRAALPFRAVGTGSDTYFTLYWDKTLKSGGNEKQD